MPVAVEPQTSRVPIPAHFALAQQSFSLKKRRVPFSSSSGYYSPISSPARLSLSLPPLPPSKGYSASRILPQCSTPWTPLSNSLCEYPSQTSLYDPSKQKSYFSQCFTNLGILGRGSFGEVYKVRSNQDGRLYAIKRSTQRFRGNIDRNRSVKEARNHEKLCPHPHILDFVAAWEEAGRLYIQTELCSSSLLVYAENKPPDESAAWFYLCDLLSALQHLHSLGFVHLDLKPANVLITDSGRLKLGDFGLLLEVKQNNAESPEGGVKEDVQEGDPKYMAPELLHGEYGPAADIFSLGVSILELACNIELPNGGEGWQQLRQGQLPSEVINGLSVELQSILKMMLAPKPSERATAAELLALPVVKKHRWKRLIFLTAFEAMWTVVSLCQFLMCSGYKLFSFFSLPSFPIWKKRAPCTPPRQSWDENGTLPLFIGHENPDDSSFLSPCSDGDISPSFIKSIESTSTPLSGSQRSSQTSRNCSPCRLTFTPSTIATNDGDTVTPSSSSDSSLAWCQRKWFQTDDTLKGSSLEPKNLLLLFDKTAQ